MKIIFDTLISLLLLIFFSPIITLFSILIFFQDYHNPLFFSERIGKNKKKFKMIKLRSMKVTNSDGFLSTKEGDSRITKIGKIVRKFKIDEITQFFNVLNGNMSIVGPRPNVEKDVNVYTLEETKLLSVKPGITDFASIIFSDESEILSDYENPEIAYNQLIRPWKSKLGLIYVKNNSIILDLKLIIYTGIAIFSKKMALKLINSDLKKMKIENDLLEISLRKNKLKPSIPPGASSIFKSY
jgi:lipopolysaccharide/colanic/teichoic acid biosynthesis glycosyltransferase